MYVFIGQPLGEVILVYLHAPARPKGKLEGWWLCANSAFWKYQVEYFFNNGAFKGRISMVLAYLHTAS